MADLAARHGAALRQAEATGDGPADGFTARIGNGFARDLDGMVARATAQPGPRPSESALDLLRRQADGLRHGLMARAALHEDALRSREQMQSIVGALDALHGLVAADPASLHEASRRLAALTGAAAPLVGGAAAAQLHDLESRRLAAAAVDGMIAEDPAAALHALSSGAFDNHLNDGAKAQLASRAALRGDALAADAERAARLAAIAADQASADRSFQAVGDLARRIDAGQASHADIAVAESRGALTAEQGSRLRDRLAAADQAQAADAAAATRVARALGDGDPLDPSSAIDRTGVDAHWRSAIVPSLDAKSPTDAASTIIGYVTDTGIAPADAVRLLTGRSFDGAPAARVAAARALADCLRIDPQAGGALLPGIREAVIRTASLADSGLPPDKAVVPLDGIDVTETSRSSAATGPTGDVAAPGNGNNGAADAAGGPTEAPTTNIAIPPKPAYKEHAFSDTDWTHWISALSDARLPLARGRIYREIFAAEGGSAVDPVNGAKSGMTQDTLDRLVGHGLLPSVRPGTRSRDLTYAQRVEAYDAYFKNALQFAPGKDKALEAIGDPELATSFAYTLFHHYPGERECAIQGAVNDVVPGRLAEDGVIGRRTIEAYAELARDPSTRRQLLDALADRQKKLLDAEAARKHEAVKQGDLDIVKHLRFLPQSGRP